ncbi:MAG: T9SS type A sorting domain-containing protein [Cryomorphaceae bacterium]|nr:T9SS type A sorting domain-containing protein [Cryomorphaceae bacterium]
MINTNLLNIAFETRTKATQMIRIISTTVLVLLVKTCLSQMPVGQWREHLPYRGTIDVCVAGDLIYAATPYAVFSLNRTDNSIERISSVNGLSSSDVSTIEFDNTTKTLVVAYNSGNVDLIKNGASFNLSDIKESNVFGDKTIYDIRIINGMAYLSCGFGVVVINIDRREVAETWYLQGQNNLVRVNSLEVDDVYWYAATGSGIFRAERNNPFLTNFASWEEMDEVPSPGADYTDIARVNNTLFVTTDGASSDELWRAEIGVWEWTNVADLESILIDDIQTNGNHLAVCTFQKITWLDENFDVFTAQQNINGNLVSPKGSVFDQQGNLWVANDFGGLLFVGTDLAERSYLPDGPPNFNARRIDAYNDNIWIASGGVDATWTNNYDKKGIYGLVNENWVVSEINQGLNDIGEINDYMCVTIDPNDNGRVFLGSWEEGLIEVKNGAITNIYNQDNSPLQLADFGGSPRVGVGGADFDESGNLWFSNAYSSAPLHLLSEGGNFTSFNFAPEIGTDDFIGDILTTRQGYVWAVIPRGKGLLVLDPNETPADPSDDNYRVLTNEEGNGALPNMDVYSIEEDLDGEIWVGTLQGITVFYAPESIFSEENFDSQQILIEQDGNIQILLETEQINSIAIDGANRKWIATASNGVFLFSPDGLEEIHHFTVNNSPLLSNNVLDIAINHKRGEIFFATDNGVISYMSDATNFDDEISTMSIYPNPVREDYNGLITIDGLAYETDIKITDVSGNVVYNSTSNGGRATWDATGPDGRRVATGIYLIFAARSDGDATNVGKIAIIR